MRLPIQIDIQSVVKKLELFPYTSAVLTLIYFENTSCRTRQMAGGLGMGVGKEKDWARSTDEKKKDRISTEKFLNNFNNCRNGVQTKVEKQARSMDRT